MQELIAAFTSAIRSSPGMLWTLILIVAAFGAVFIWLLVDLARRDRQLEARNPGAADTLPRASRMFLYVLFGIAAIGLFTRFVFSSNGDAASRSFISVAALILIGIAAFIGIMGQLSKSAKSGNFLDSRYPFGLPDGSVRAILTIAFIVLVGVMSSFLVTVHNNRIPFSASGMDESLHASQAAALARATVVGERYGADAMVTVNEREGDDPDGTGPLTAASFYAVIVHFRVNNDMADDISKQTLTMISTILAAMIGFYFADRAGARAGEGTQAAADMEGRSKLVQSLGVLKRRLEDAKAKISARIAAYAAVPEGEIPQAKTLREAGLKAVQEASALAEQIEGRVPEIEIQLEQGDLSGDRLKQARTDADRLATDLSALEKKLPGL